MGAVGAATAGCLTLSVATAGAAFIGATGAEPALFLRSAPAVAPDLSYFFSVSFRFCLDSFARALYSPTLRSESRAVSTSAVVCSEISGRVSFALMASGENEALNILFLNGRKGRFSTLQTRRREINRVVVIKAFVCCWMGNRHVFCSPHLAVQSVGVGNHLLQTRLHTMWTRRARIEVCDGQHDCSCHNLHCLLCQFSNIVVHYECCLLCTVSWCFFDGPAIDL